MSNQGKMVLKTENGECGGCMKKGGDVPPLIWFEC